MLKKYNFELQRLTDTLKDTAMKHKTSVSNLKQNASAFGVSETIDKMNELMTP